MKPLTARPLSPRANPAMLSHRAMGPGLEVNDGTL
jgi:hypothetical protein